MTVNGSCPIGLLDRSLAVLLVWHGGIAVDPEFQRGPHAASRRALVEALDRDLALTPQQRRLAAPAASRGRQALGDLALRHLGHHSRLLACLERAGRPQARRLDLETADLARSLDRFLSAALSIASELGQCLDPVQERRALRLAGRALDDDGLLVWLTGLAASVRRPPAWIAPVLDVMAIPAELVHLARRQALCHLHHHGDTLQPEHHGDTPHGDTPSNERHGDTPQRPAAPPPQGDTPRHDGDTPWRERHGDTPRDAAEVLMWLTDDALAAAIRRPRCLAASLLNLLMMVPGFLDRASAAPACGRATEALTASRTQPGKEI